MSFRTRIFSGGHGHPFAETTAIIGRILTARGQQVSTNTDFGVCIDQIDDFDLLVVNALRWTMTQDEKYIPFRASFAFQPAWGQMDRLTTWVEDGGRLLAFHTAVICFDTEPGWLEMLGGGWRWGVSHHPPRGPLRVEPVDAPAFQLIDEVYHNMSPRPHIDVRATCDVGNGPQPVAWTHFRGKGRVAVDTLGHDRQSFETKGHVRLIGGLIDWLEAA